MNRKQKTLFWLRQSYIWIVLVLIYLPLFVVVLVSFNGSTNRGNINLVFGVPDAEGGGSAYADLVADGDFVNSLLNSLIVAVVVTPIATIIATAASFAIWNNKAFYRKATIGVSNASISTPEIIAGLSLIILFTLTWLSFNQSLGLFTIIVSHISFCAPYALVTIYPRMQKMNVNLILASADLGYGKFQTFFRITVPYLLPAILSGAAIAFAMSFDDFIITNLVRGSAQTVSSQLYTMRKGVKAWAAAFGALVVFATVAVTCAFAVRKYFSERAKHRDSVLRRSARFNRVSLRDLKKPQKAAKGGAKQSEA